MLHRSLRFYSKLILVCLILVARASVLSAYAQGDYPSRTDPFVNDFSRALDATSTANLRALLQEIKQEHGIETVVVVVNSVRDYSTSDYTVESFATGLFNSWEIGDAQRNDGVLLLVALNDRKVRIELGEAYGRTHDLAMQAILDEHILPGFRQNQYGTALYEGVRAIAHELTGKWPARLPEVAPSSPVAPGWLGVAGIIFGLIGVSVGSVLAVRALRATGWLTPAPRCEKCGKALQQVSVERKKDYLNPGQVQEEHLNTAYYETWQCAKCQSIQLNRVPQTRPDSQLCLKCSYQTVIVRIRTLSEPTYQSAGRREIKKYCYSCQYQSTEETTFFQLLPDELPEPKDDHDPLARLWNDQADATSSTVPLQSSRAHRSRIFSGRRGGRSGGGGATGSW